MQIFLKSKSKSDETRRCYKKHNCKKGQHIELSKVLTVSQDEVNEASKTAANPAVLSEAVLTYFKVYDFLILKINVTGPTLVFTILDDQSPVNECIIKWQLKTQNTGMHFKNIPHESGKRQAKHTFSYSQNTGLQQIITQMSKCGKFLEIKSPRFWNMHGEMIPPTP